MIRILIDGRLLDDRETGISRYIKEMIRSYQDEPSKYDTFILVNDRSWTRIYPKAVVTALKPFNLVHFFRLSRLISSISPDVFHSPFYSSSYFKAQGVRYITTVHDLMYKIVPSFFGKSPVKRLLAVAYYDFIVIRSLKNADVIISVSKTTAADVRKYFGFDSLVIPEGVNLTHATGNEGNEGLVRWGLITRGYYLYVGNLRPHKNVDFLVRCFLKSSSKRHLVIVSRDRFEYRGELSERVKVPGYVTDSELSQLYQNCLAFVCPSLYEGFGLPILEALSHRVPVLAASSGALLEFSDAGVNYFDPYMETSLITYFNAENFSYSDSAAAQELRKYDWSENFSSMKKQIVQKKALTGN